MDGAHAPEVCMRLKCCQEIVFTMAISLASPVSWHLQSTESGSSSQNHRCDKNSAKLCPTQGSCATSVCTCASDAVELERIDSCSTAASAPFGSFSREVMR